MDLEVNEKELNLEPIGQLGSVGELGNDEEQLLMCLDHPSLLKIVLCGC